MGKNINVYTNEVVEQLKDAAKDNALKRGDEDKGFNVVISKADIKKETNRSRIKGSVLSTVVNGLTSSGFEATESGGVINVYVPPILADKDVFTMDEIKERNRITEEINVRAAYSAMDT